MNLGWQGDFAEAHVSTQLLDTPRFIAHIQKVFKLILELGLNLSHKRPFLRNILIPRYSAGWLRKAIEEDYVLLVQAEPREQHLPNEESQQAQITGYASQSSNVRVAIKA